jgi:hypothetical protein
VLHTKLRNDLVLYTKLRNDLVLHTKAPLRNATNGMTWCCIQKPYTRPHTRHGLVLHTKAIYIKPIRDALVLYTKPLTDGGSGAPPEPSSPRPHLRLLISQATYTQDDLVLYREAENPSHLLRLKIVRGLLALVRALTPPPLPPLIRGIGPLHCLASQ